MSEKNNQLTLQKGWVVSLLSLVCVFLWASAYPTVKICYREFNIGSDDTMSQILLAGWRFAVAGVLVIIVGSIIAKKFLVPTRKSWGKICSLALVQTIIQYVLYYIGMAHLTGIKGSIISGTNVFLSVLVTALIFRQEKLTWAKIVGCIFGFLAIVVINLGGDVGGGFTFLGDGLFIISQLAYAAANAMIRMFARDENPVMLNGYQFLVGGIIMIIIGYAGGGRLAASGITGYLVLIYMSFLAAGAYTLWGILLKYNPVSKVVVFGTLQPLFGAVLSAILLGELATVNWGRALVGLILMCAGIYIVNGLSYTIEAGKARKNVSG